jgi:hypothetical protein
LFEKKISTGGENYRFAGKFKKFGRLFERLIQRAEPVELPKNKTYFIYGQSGREREREREMLLPSFWLPVPLAVGLPSRLRFR